MADPAPRPLSRQEGMLLNWAMLVALEQPIGEDDRVILAGVIQDLLRGQPALPDEDRLGAMPGHMQDIVAAWRDRSRDHAAEGRLVWWARSYFLARNSRAEAAGPAR